jgi:hypothetical protein
MDMYETAQIFAYERKENSAVIWRCFSRDTKAELPGQIEGCPVTSVAPYAFSSHMEKGLIERGLESGKLQLFVPEYLRESTRGLPDPLCGDALEEIVLPETVRQVGRYCFYNCGNLHRIAFCGALSDWGSGVFTGCHQVYQLSVFADRDGKSYLKDVLDELPEALQVEYHIDASLAAHLVFPEFYEEGVENTPARILETHVHGSGIRYRNCFQGRTFDFRQYDALFPYAKAQEEAAIVAQLVMDRLRFPVALDDLARRQYEIYTAEHGEDLARLLLKKQDVQGIRWLLDVTGKEKMPDPSLLDYLMQEAARLNFAEVTGILMEYRHSHTPSAGRRRRLEL